MQKIMTCVGIVGVMVVGAMCKDMFWASIPVVIGSGDDAQTMSLHLSLIHILVSY